MRSLLLLIALVAAEAPASRWSRAEYAGVFTDPTLNEVSGLAVSHVHPGIYWAQNDGDNGSKIYAIRASGALVATFQIAGVDNIDWEDIDSFELDGKHYLLIADTGDNGGIRKALNLVVVEEPAVLKDGQTLRIAWTIPFRWPDGARDCEATAVDAAAGEVLLISKKRVPPELFRVPLRAGDGLKTAELLTTLQGISQPSEAELKKNPVYGRYRSQISGADLSPNGRVLAVLNYHSILLYVRASNESWSRAARSQPGELVLPWLPQAEGIAFSGDGRSLLIASEKRPAPLFIFRVLH